jgi:hypothetical protein
MPIASVQLRLSEVLAALSSALDLTEGQTIGHSARSCLIGMRLAERLDLPPDQRHGLFYALLLKDAGCSSNAGRLASLFQTDDHTLKREHKLIDWTRTLPAFRYASITVAIDREAQFGPDGETRSGDTGPQGTECYETLKGIRTIDGLANHECPDPPPPPPADPCEPNPVGLYLGICRVEITNVGQYEDWPRGSPEVSIYIFSVNPDGGGHVQLGCLNEDETGASYYDQDVDTWVGNARLATNSTMMAEVASGRRVGIAVWEDDTGSKCHFAAPDLAVRLVFGALLNAGAYACFSGFSNSTFPTQLEVLACYAGAISWWVWASADDQIGVAGKLTSPTATSWNLMRESGSSILNTGTVWFKRTSN